MAKKLMAIAQVFILGACQPMGACVMWCEQAEQTVTDNTANDMQVSDTVTQSEAKE